MEENYYMGRARKRNLHLKSLLLKYAKNAKQCIQPHSYLSLLYHQETNQRDWEKLCVILITN